MDYVYKVKVVSAALTYTIDRFTVLVEDVIISSGINAEYFFFFFFFFF
uniref:Uncharacterized protein n=1 Tax=Anguilla anguilla TaxID=7936 RepID=A0A0E9RWS0_ANGAN